MKIKMTLDYDDIRHAIAAWVTQQTGVVCHPEHVHKGTYSFDLPYVEIDTDAEQELASIATQQALEAALAVKEAALAVKEAALAVKEVA